MKASVNTIYGPPEVLQVMEVEKPIPKANEVLIKIYATTVNRTDCGFRKPEYLIVRLISGIFKPRKTILGTELAGEVEAVGSQVKNFKTGDQVFGLSTFHFGTHAEYVCIDENKSIAIKPKNVSFQEAAPICEGAWYALTYYRKVNLKKGDKILINGATGAIGSAAVQLAKYFGAEITAVANTKNIELIKSLGASFVIDYTKEDFTEINEQYDYVFDAVGKSSFIKCKKILKPKGTYFSTELGYLSQNIFLALVTPVFFGKKVIFPIPKDTKEIVLFFKDLVEKGHFKAVIEKTYPLEEIVEATKYVETGQKTGNIVINLAHHYQS